MPRGVLRHDIEEDVAVDQNRSHSIVAGQRHDRIGGHCNVAAAAQMGHKASPPAVLAADLGSDIRTTLPSNSNSASVCGSKPARSRISAAMVTCPLDVIRMAISYH